MARAAHTRWWQIAEVMFGVPALVAVGLQVLLPVRVLYGQFAPFAVHAVESDLGGRRLRMSLRVHGETIVATHVEPSAPGLNHTVIERALADTPRPPSC